MLLPLLGFAILIFFGKKIGTASGWIASSFLGIDLILSVVVAWSKFTTHVDAGMIQYKFDWVMLGTKNIAIGIGVDNLAAAMLIVVNLISFLVHIFSTEYMHGDKRYPRFFAYLQIFTFSMLGIVIANNFLNMYIFWELVGLSSYLLIGFWYEKDSAANANKKAFITNRIGDLGFFIGIMILFYTYGTFMFDDIFAQMKDGVIPWDSGTMLTLAGIGIFMGAIGKSAQFPLHVWLPDAMEGPTPVSALIHAATMVAAGVYLTARVFPMFTADALLFIAYIGAFTAFMAATIALTQTDFKRVLAYSTVSQLGYMIMAVGVGAYTTGFFHLVTHAWFKACLFLASGSVIHAMHVSMHHAHDHSMDAQDIRNMGGLRKTMPLTYITFLMATLAISGVPLTSGFLSKDGILAGTLAFGQLTGHWIIPIFGFGAAGMTAFYMFRLAIVSFHGKPKNDIAKHTKENKFVVVFPLALLSFMSLWFFYSWNPLDASSGWFMNTVKQQETVVPHELQYDFIVPYLQVEEHEIMKTEHQSVETLHIEAGHEPESAEHSAHHGFNQFEDKMHDAHVPAMIASLLIAGMGILIAFMFYQFKIFSADKLALQFNKAYKISKNKWYFDEIYQATAINGTVGLGKLMSWFDLYVVDGLVNLTAAIGRFLGWFSAKFDNIVVDGLVNLLAWITGVFGALFRKVQTGHVQTYVIFLLMGLILLYLLI
ncbi:MAG: NADH-quinone oxidoreductase subunit L [Candidatus Kapaibacterium sp.]